MVFDFAWGQTADHSRSEWITLKTGLVVACSGGGDSVALARRVHRAGTSPLVLAHVNHQLRGAASDADEAFVRQLAGQLGATFASVRFQTSQAPGNLEANARRERYDWLALIAQQHRIGTVATGHTADDQAETLLHRIIRGTGWAGLCGIHPRRELAPGVQLVRPLLQVTRQELRDELAVLGQPFREDASNADPRFTRNRIRRYIMPALLDADPQALAKLLRLRDRAAAVTAERTTIVQALLVRVELPRAGTLVVLDASVLAKVERPMLRELFRHLWLREGWLAGQCNRATWNRLADVAVGLRPAVDLPAGLRARRRGRVVQVGPLP